MEYREKLDVKGDIPFGIEIEVGNQRTTSITPNVLKKYDMQKFINIYEDIKARYGEKYANNIAGKMIMGDIDDPTHYWLYHYENCSDYSIFDGLEVSSPVLHNDIESFKQIEKVTDMLKSINSIPGKRAGAHIHIGAEPFSNLDQIINLLKLYALYEPIFYLYSAKGNLGFIRPQAQYSAESIRNTLAFINNSHHLLQQFVEMNCGKEDKHSGIHFKSFDFTDHDYGSSFEFRIFNGTVDKKVWQNYINIILNFVSYCLIQEIDEDQLNYRLKKLLQNHNTWSIDEIIANATPKLIDEFGNTIFDSDTDKKDYFDHIEGKCLKL